MRRSRPSRPRRVQHRKRPHPTAALLQQMQVNANLWLLHSVRLDQSELISSDVVIWDTNEVLSRLCANTDQTIWPKHWFIVGKRYCQLHRLLTLLNRLPMGAKVVLYISGSINESTDRNRLCLCLNNRTGLHGSSRYTTKCACPTSAFQIK